MLLLRMHKEQKKDREWSDSVVWEIRIRIVIPWHREKDGTVRVSGAARKRMRCLCSTGTTNQSQCVCVCVEHWCSVVLWECWRWWVLSEKVFSVCCWSAYLQLLSCVKEETGDEQEQIEFYIVIPVRSLCV